MELFRRTITQKCPGSLHPCSLSRNQEDISFSEGRKCPECGDQLQPTKVLDVRAIAIAVVVVAILGGGIATLNVFPKNLVSSLFNMNNTKVKQKSNNSADKNYERAIQLIEQAISKKENYQTLNELETAYENFKTGREILEELPKNTNLYSDAQNKLEQHNSDFQSLESLLQKEREAKKKSTLAMELAEKAQRKTSPEKVKDVSKLKNAKQNWKEAIDTIESAPKNTLVSAKLEKQRNDYQKQLKEVKERINELTIMVDGKKVPYCGAGAEPCVW